MSAQLGHLPGPGGEPRTPKGKGGTPSDWVDVGHEGEWRGSEGGGEVEAGWDQRPRGVDGGGEGIPHQEGDWEGRGSKGSMTSISLAHLGPQEPAAIQGLIFCPRRPLQPGVSCTNSARGFPFLHTLSSICCL